MTPHAFALISARKDEPLDARTELVVHDHLASCAECRAFEREIESFDGLLRIPEPEVALPPRREQPTQWIGWRIGRIAALGVLALVIALVVGEALRERRVVPSASSEVGVTLAGVSLGAGPTEVRNTLGEASYFADAGRMWIYGGGLVVFFDGPADRPERVERIFASAGRAARTTEGFSSGSIEEFRKAYSAHTIAVRKGARFQTVLSVTGSGRDGADVSVLALFDGFEPLNQATEYVGMLTYITIFRGRPFSAPPDPCRLIGTALGEAGLANAVDLGPSGELEGYPPRPGDYPGGIQPWGGLACYSRNSHDPTLEVRFEPTPAAGASTLLPRISPGAVGSSPVALDSGITSWTRANEGVWLGHGYVSSAFGPLAWSWIAVSEDPYFFVVSAETDEMVRRLAESVLRHLR